MLKEDRQEKILELLEQCNSISIADLSEQLDVSLMTVRRDLDDMDKQGLLKKVYGGAIITKNEQIQPSFFIRSVESTEEKQRIAHAAVSLISPGSIVFFDGGTTPYFVAKCIPEALSFTAITNNLMTAAELCSKPNVNVIMLGGEVHHSSFSSLNQLALAQIKSFNANLALVSTKAFSYPEGMFEAILPLIEIKKAIVAASEHVVLLLDHSKFETKSLSLSVPLSEIDEIITDAKAPRSIIDKISESGTKVTLV